MRALKRPSTTCNPTSHLSVPPRSLCIGNKFRQAQSLIGNSGMCFVMDNVCNRISTHAVVGGKINLFPSGGIVLAYLCNLVSFKSAPTRHDPSIPHAFCVCKAVVVFRASALNVYCTRAQGRRTAINKARYAAKLSLYYIQENLK